MKPSKLVTLAFMGLAAVGAAALWPGQASSHREAPAISQDPLAGNTDLYAFVSPSTPDKVTIIANFIPLEAPYGGPDFFQVDDNARYEKKNAKKGRPGREVTGAS